MREVLGKTSPGGNGYKEFGPMAVRCMFWGMNRRDFLLRSSLLVSAGVLARASLQAQPAAPAMLGAFRPLRRNVGLYTGRGGTIGWLANADAVVAVDTQFPDTAAECLAGLPGRAGRMLDAVINTHHHRDHTSGNGVFKPASKTIVAQENARKLQFAAAERDGTVASQVFANETFSEVWRRELGDEVVTAQYHGAGHTKGDVIVHFERANVVHLGDLLFNRAYPVIDREGGASVRHWITVLEEAVATYPKDAIYMCGHGNPKFGVTGTQGDLLVFRDYLSGLCEHVEKEIAAGKKKEEIVTLDNLPGFDDFHAPLPNRLGGNLSVAYDELTDKQG